jgi:hypothetical protein
MAAGGQDIRVVADLAPGGPGMAPGAVADLASDLAAIFGGAGVPLSGDEITDAEADALWPAKTLAAAREREQQVAAAQRQLADMSDSDLYSALFTASAGEPGAPLPAFDARPGAAPGHEAYTGTHLHEHASYNGAGGRHAHPHTHEGDGNHDHPH